MQMVRRACEDDLGALVAMARRFHGSSQYRDWSLFDGSVCDAMLLTFSLSGTGSDSADDWVETAWTSIWADVTALSGTSAAVTLTTEC